MRRSSLFAVLSACLFSACKSVEQNAPPVAQLNTSHPDRCEQGRSVYTTVCADCHGVKPVRALTFTEWHGDTLPRMSRKAHLSPELEATVLAYIQAVLDTPLPDKQP